jgi:hypothetical protein
VAVGTVSVKVVSGRGSALGAATGLIAFFGLVLIAGREVALRAGEAELLAGVSRLGTLRAATVFVLAATALRGADAGFFFILDTEAMTVSTLGVFFGFPRKTRSFL